MAEEQENVEIEAPSAPPAAGGNGRMMMIAFVAVMVLLETGMFFFLVPSAEDVSALAEAQLIKSVQEVDELAEQEASSENEFVEFPLGMYGEVFSPHDTEQTYRVELKLYGLIRMKNEEMMREEFDKKEGRIRSTIRQRIRNSSLEDLNENQLGLLERGILTACNHWLKEDLLLAVGFKSYQLIEQ